MLLSIFRLNYAFIAILLCLTLAAFWVIPFTQNFSHAPDSHSIFDISFSTIDNHWSMILGYVATCAIAFLCNQLINGPSLLGKASSLPGFLLGVSLLYDPANFFLRNEHLYFICLLSGCILLNRIHRNFASIEICFLFGVIISIGSLFLSAGICGLLISWVYLSILRPFEWREYFAPLLGALLVGIALFSIQLFKQEGSLHMSGFAGDLNLFLSYSGNKEISFVLAVFSTVVFLLGLSGYVQTYSLSVLRWKKISRSILLSFLLLGLGAYLVNWFLYANQSFWFICLLFSLIASFYFQKNGRKWLQVFLFHGWLILIVINHIV